MEFIKKLLPVLFSSAIDFKKVVNINRIHFAQGIKATSV